MKRFMKVCLILAIIFGIAGIGCIAAALSMGAAFPKSLTGFWGSHRFRFGEKAKQEYRFDKQRIHSIDIDIGSGNLRVVKGTGDEIIVKNSSNDAWMRAELESDGTLSIDRKSAYFWFFGIGSGGDAVLTLPEDVSLDELNLEVGSGDVSIESVNAKETSIDCGSGDIVMDKLTAHDTDIDCGSGNIDIKFTGKKELYNYEIDCGSGDIIIGTEHFSGSEYEHENHSGSGNIEIDCGSGNVAIDFLNYEDI